MKDLSTACNTNTIIINWFNITDLLDVEKIS